MKYQEVAGKMPNATLIYENVTKDELLQITVSKYELETEINSGIFYVGTNEDVEFLSSKKMDSTDRISFN